MIPKLKPLQKQIYAYINNALCTDVDTETICKEVSKRFPTYYIYHNISKDMQIEMINQMVWCIKYTKDFN